MGLDVQRDFGRAAVARLDVRDETLALEAQGLGERLLSDFQVVLAIFEDRHVR